MERLKIFLTSNQEQRQKALDLLNGYCDELNKIPVGFIHERWIGYYLFIHDGTVGVNRGYLNVCEMLSQCKILDCEV